MESDIALALMEKARMVYGSDSTFLSFPVSPIAFEPEELLFFENSKDDDTGKKALSSQSQFSRLVNLIPTGMTWPPDEERYLWDVYDDILDTAVVASSDRTEAEEEQYQEVAEFLYDEMEDGLRVPSAAKAKYQEFYDASIALQEQFNEEKIEAELSESIDLKNTWTNTRLPEWQARFDKLEKEWREKGSKDKIEWAQRTEKSLASRSPSRTWDEWSAMFDKELDTRLSSEALPFVPTRYAPANATQDGSWIEFSMSKAVAQNLIKNAPEKLRKKLEGQALAVNNLKSLTFEYSTAKVDRFWFTPEVFKSRFFRYPKLISEGADNNQGQCPAYVAGIIFARNIKVEEHEASSQASFPMVRRQVSSPVSFDFVDQMKAKKLGAVVSSPVVASTVVRDRRVARAEPAGIQRAERRDHRRPRRQTRVAAVRGNRKAPIKNIHRVVRLPFAVLPGQTRIPAANPPQTPRSAAKPSAPEKDDSIYILALICKRVPKCPDPDPGLDWEFE